MSAKHSCISPKVRLGELSACSIKACGSIIIIIIIKARKHHRWSFHFHY